MGRCVANDLRAGLVASTPESVDREHDRPELSSRQTCRAFFRGTGLTDRCPTSWAGRTSATAGCSNSLTATVSTRTISRFGATRSTSRSDHADLRAGRLSKLNRNVDPTIEDLRDVEELRFAARILIPRYWSIFGATVIDLTDKTEDPLRCRRLSRSAMPRN